MRTVGGNVLVLIMLVFAAAGASGCLMSVEEEVALGQKAAPEFEAQSGGPYPSDVAQAYVARVGMSMVAELSPEERNGYQFSFILLNDGIVNAFALPGGPVFITRGLLVKMSSEDELAGVLGHEIGHVVHRHTAYRMQRAMGLNALLLILNVALQVGGGPGYVADVSGLVVQLTDMRYGRDDESESDMSGADFMVRSGYDPRGLIMVMRILKASGGGAMPEFFSTHPDPENREGAIKAEILKKWPALVRTKPVYRKESFEKMMAAARLTGSGGKEGYGAYDAAERLRIKAEKEKVAGKKTASREMFLQAETAYSQAIESLPGHALPYVGRGRVRWRLNRMTEALDDLNRAVGYEPKNHTARVTRARLRLEARNDQGALEDMDIAIKQVASYALGYFYRGKARYRLSQNEGAISDLRNYLSAKKQGPNADEARAMLKTMGATS